MEAKFTSHHRAPQWLCLGIVAYWAPASMLTSALCAAVFAVLWRTRNVETRSEIATDKTSVQQPEVQIKVDPQWDAFRDALGTFTQNGDLGPIKTVSPELAKAIEDRRETAELDPGLVQVLEDMQQGYCTISEGLQLHSASGYVQKTLGAFEGQVGLQEYLINDKYFSEEQCQSALFHFSSIFGMSPLQWSISSQFYPKECKLKVNFKEVTLSLNYFPIYDSSERVKEIRVVICEASEISSAKLELEERQHEMQRIFALLRVPEGVFDQFVEETTTIFRRMRAEFKILEQAASGERLGMLVNMMRDLHTIKGNAGLFNFTYITTICQKVESFLEEFIENPEVLDTGAIAELKDLLIEVNEEIYSYTSIRRDLVSQVEREQEASVAYRLRWLKSLLQIYGRCVRDQHFTTNQAEEIQWQLTRVLSSFGQSSLMQYVSNYDSMIQELCLKLRKKMSPLQIDLEYRYFDRRTLGKINDCLLHLIRNCIDHGVESPYERMARGKSEAGHLRINSYAASQKIIIEFSDDGRGIDTHKLGLKAVERGIVSRENLEKMNEFQITQLIFEPGLTVKRSVTELSGRGLGMDAVRKIVGEMGGTVEVHSESQAGVTFKLIIPDLKDNFFNHFKILDVANQASGCLDQVEVFKNLGDLEFHFESHSSENSAMVDEKYLNQLLNRIVISCVSRMQRESSLELKLESFPGRRRVDSHQFFRMTFSCSQLTKALSQQAEDIADLTDMAAYLQGSLICRSGQVVELNFPSLIPCAFNAIPINVKLFVDSQRDPELRSFIAGFFRQHLGGWEYTVTSEAANKKPFAATEAGASECWEFVIVDESCIEKLVAEESKPDAVIVLVTHVEGLSLRSREAESIAHGSSFLPLPLKQYSFNEVLNELVLKRFISELGSQHPGNQSSDILGSLERVAG